MPPESTSWRIPRSLVGVVMLLLIAVLAVPTALGAGEIAAENARAGTPGWQYPEASRGTLADQYAGTVRSIDGYADRVSVQPGGTVGLRVSTVAGVAYRVEVFRLGWYGGAGARRVACVPGCSSSRLGVQQPAPPAPDPATGIVRAGWAATDTIDVGADWVSGYYVAQLVITAGTDAGKARWVPFVVRAPAGDTTPILVQVPVNTWQAYNGWGGRSLYDNKSVTGIRASKVSFDRPYWSNMFDLFDHEYQLVRFMEREGYDVTYATDADVDAAPSMLQAHRAVVVNGHGEYWTMTQRDAMDAARSAGVNLAFIGANIGYWHVRYEDGRRTLVGYKSLADPVADPGMKTVMFRDLGRPECQLLGVQYQETWATDSVDRRYGVDPASASDPWLAGTGLTAGATLAGTVGYEWDLIQPGCQARPLTRLFTWDDPSDALLGADAVRYTAASGARVFAAGSMQFSFGLDGWRYGANTGSADPRLQAFMRNLLRDMGAPAPPPSPNIPPTAAFTVSPSAPLTGQAVTFTDTSTDADGTVASRSWDLNGDGTYGDATGPLASRTFAAAGTFTVGLRVTDDAGATVATTRSVTVTAAPAPQPVVNLVANPGFETNTTGWSGWQSTITRVALGGAPGGSHVARVALATGTSDSIGETTGSVRNQLQSTRVTASAWAAAANAQTVGRPVVLRLRERTTTGTLVRETSSPAVILTTAFQRLDVATTTAQSGTVVDVRISQTAAAAGDAFYADAFSVFTGDPTPPPNTPPTASFAVSPPSTVTGRDVTLTDTSTDADGTVASRSWDLDGDGTYGDATGATATVSWPSAGTYAVGLQVTDDRGGIAVATRTVVVSDPPPDIAPTAAITVSPASPVAGRTVTFTDASTDPDGTIAARSWDLDGDGAYGDATGATATRVYPAAGTYTVGLQVTDDRGATASTTVEVTVADPPPNAPPAAAFTASPQSPVTGQAVTLTDTSTDADGTIAARSWDLDGDGAYGDATGATATTSFATAGPHTVGLQVTDDQGATGTTTRTLTVAVPANVPPTAAFTVAPAAPQTGQVVTFTDASADTDGRIVGRSWDLDGNGTYGDATGTTATRTYAAAGAYTVGLQVTDDRGAVVATTRTVTVAAPPPPVTNLVLNPGFESNATSWSGWQATVTRVALAGAPGGGYVARVARSTGTSDSIGETTGSVRNQPAGTRITGTAWVAAANAQTAGRPVVLRLRERNTAGTVIRETSSAPLTLTTAFQRIQVVATTAQAGTVVDLRISQTTAAAGDAFHADEFSVTLG